MIPVTLRRAVAADQAVIQRIVRDANINPRDLSWPRFVVAEQEGRVVGVGQIKLHGDGSRELASLAVVPERQGQGIASSIVRALVDSEGGVLYLMCRSQLEGFYTRFGFRRIERAAMPPYFRRWHRIVNLLLSFSKTRLIVMRRG